MERDHLHPYNLKCLVYSQEEKQHAKAKSLSIELGQMDGSKPRKYDLHLRAMQWNRYRRRLCRIGTSLFGSEPLG
jgi:hypothetical protein